MENSTVRAVNRLTGRWAAVVRPGAQGTVFTAAGVWPLLALLADGAGGPAREELAAALGIPAGDAAGAARALLEGLGPVRGLETATGLWTRAGLPLEEAWTSRLPDGARGSLTGDPDVDRPVLDGWAAERTGGLIEHMPVPVGPEVLMVLASALALRVTWSRPFDDFPAAPDQGPWAGRTSFGLHRRTSRLDRARVTRSAGGPVTLLEVEGSAGIDVHLLLGGPDAAPGEVLGAGIAAVTGAAPAEGAGTLPEGTPGPGLEVRTVESVSSEPSLHIKTVAFALRAEHDLLAHAELFGLATASDDTFGHFPGISSDPLAVGAARQSAMARFHAKGFEAAAVTAVSMRAGGGAPRTLHRVRHATVSFLRPFGFLALHRPSRLVLAAGWVNEPLPYEAPDRGPRARPGGLLHG
ncbi:proteinase inhibitor I4 serpin [Streptomyces sp. NBC_00536]|uniref:serpin family protein n=1 Tax=Streptomyces sp. NBC_00536 TaxID=2975769 RepID=UPI002E804536|nr:serpin family protein [Streptomyces sp. NBC_00536]WUC82638.1 proteinase inhibitor I4 serpin [Streptomyces sp. NBC_00536]